MEDGVQLSALTELDFISRIPQGGATLYAQLEIWKAACSEHQQLQQQQSYFNGQDSIPMSDNMQTMADVQSWNSPMDCDTIDDTVKSGNYLSFRYKILYEN